MDFYTASDNEIVAEIGRRLKAARLRKNKTQEHMADNTLLSLRIIKGLEKGQGKLPHLVMYLRELNLLHEIDHFVPEISVSPMQILKQKGKVRRRATGSHAKPTDKGEPEW
jgi:transcriptional regulator with XRE-family HTH domain